MSYAATLFSNARMLTLVTLVAWSAASVASAMPVAITSSGNDFSPWNAIYTSIVGSNPDISRYAGNAEERGIMMPEDIDSVFGKWHLSRFQELQNLPKKEQLVSQIRRMDDSFSHLIKATENRNIFEGQSIHNWVNYVMSIYMNENKDTQKTAVEAMFVMLISHFNEDLASVLVAGEKIKTAKYIVHLLLELQLEEWKQLKKDPAEVFKLLQLHKPDGDNPLQNPLFTQWTVFVKSRHHEGSEAAYQEMLSVLVEHYNDDVVGLGSALVAGTKTNDNKRLATQLLHRQLQTWGTAKIAYAEKIYKILELQETGDKLFASPLFSEWIVYCKLRYGKTQDMSEMFWCLKHHYVTKDLIRAIVAGLKTKGVEKTKTAAKLLKLQIKQWVSDKTSEQEVFELLQIHQASGAPYERPLFFTWAEFVKSKYKSTEEAEMVKYRFLADHCKGDDLTKVFIAGTKIGSTKSSAEEGLNNQIGVWQIQKRDVANIFELLELDQKIDRLFDSPVFFTWITYVKSIFSDHLEANKVMISILKGVYGDDLGKVLAVPAHSERMKTVAKELQKTLYEGSPKVPQRHNIDFSKPSSQKRQKIDLNEPLVSETHLNEPSATIGFELPTLQRPKPFDLNDPMPETETNLDLPRERKLTVESSIFFQSHP